MKKGSSFDEPFRGLDGTKKHFFYTSQILPKPPKTPMNKGIYQN